MEESIIKTEEGNKSAANSGREHILPVMDSLGDDEHYIYNKVATIHVVTPLQRSTFKIPMPTSRNWPLLWAATPNISTPTSARLSRKNYIKRIRQSIWAQKATTRGQWAKTDTKEPKNNYGNAETDIGETIFRFCHIMTEKS